MDIQGQVNFVETTENRNETIKEDESSIIKYVCDLCNLAVKLRTSSLQNREPLQSQQLKSDFTKMLQ